MNSRYSRDSDIDMMDTLEDQFCKNFSCCGLELQDLHELLQHFEECHVDVRYQGDEDDEVFEIENMDSLSDSSELESPRTFTDYFFKPLGSSQPSIAHSDIYHDPSVTPSFVKPSMTTTMMDNKVEMTDLDDRPYKCKISGCTKAYKNPGGLKYHLQHGHCEDTGDPEMNQLVQKPYECTVAGCGRRYKNLNGLKVLLLLAYVRLVSH